MTMIIAECERCGGRWRVPEYEPDDPDLLEGICMDCQEDSDVERPLTFRRWGSDRDTKWDETLDVLPTGWIA